MAFFLYFTGVVLVLLLIGNLSTRYFQDYFIFRPEKLPEAHRYVFLHPFEEFWLDTPAGGRINGLWFKLDSDRQAARGVILYFHGNMGSLRRWGHVYYHLLDKGYDLIICDYRGFGKSKGRRNEHNMLQDALSAYVFAERHYKAEDIVLFGRSLGSAFATFLAAEKHCKMLILETPFSSMRDLFHAYFPFLPPVFRFKYVFDNKEQLKQVRAPVHIFHGTKDLVVPHRVAARLKPCLKTGDTFTTIEGGRHNDLLFYDLYNEQLRAVLG